MTNYFVEMNTRNNPTMMAVVLCCWSCSVLSGIWLTTSIQVLLVPSIQWNGRHQKFLATQSSAASLMCGRLVSLA